MNFQLNRQDRKSLALHQAMARMIEADPSLIARVRRCLDGWLEVDEPPAYALEWDRTLGKPLPEILAFVTGETEKAADLRQSSPFTACRIVPDRERWAILEEFNRQWRASDETP